MDALRYGELNLHLRHRHDDGSWGRLEPRPGHHSPADHDPERDWPNGVVYACTSCDEVVLVSHADDEPIE